MVRPRFVHTYPTIVIPAQAGIQRNVGWIPAFAGMTGWVSSHLPDTRQFSSWAGRRPLIAFLDPPGKPRPVPSSYAIHDWTALRRTSGAKTLTPASASLAAADKMG